MTDALSIRPQGLQRLDQPINRTDCTVHQKARPNATPRAKPKSAHTEREHWRSSGGSECVNSNPQQHGLYSSVAERQSCKLKVLGSIPSGGYYPASTPARQAAERFLCARARRDIPQTSQRRSVAADACLCRAPCQPPPLCHPVWSPACRVSPAPMDTSNPWDIIFLWAPSSGRASRPRVRLGIGNGMTKRTRHVTSLPPLLPRGLWSPRAAPALAGRGRPCHACAKTWWWC